MSSVVIIILSGQYGFPLTYDILLETIPFKVHFNDNPYNWGRMLLRMLPPTDYKVSDRVRHNKVLENVPGN